MNASLPSDDLPTFARPPVSEVTMSIQFASITGFRTVHVGLLWNMLRELDPDAYRNVTEQAPLPPVFETFGSGQVPSPPQVRFEAVLVPPMPRFRLESSDGAHVLQIQQDRLVHNWLKGNDHAYPRYGALRARFLHEIDMISQFLATENLGALQPNQCELVYTNFIVLPDGSNPHQQIERITPLWGGWKHSRDLAPIENASFGIRYPLQASEAPFGRVYIEVQPIIMNNDRSQAIKMDITVRGKPQEGTVESAFRLLDAERRAIVRTFEKITTKEMHAFWEKVQ